MDVIAILATNLVNSHAVHGKITAVRVTVQARRFNHYTDSFVARLCASHTSVLQSAVVCIYTTGGVSWQAANLEIIQAVMYVGERSYFNFSAALQRRSENRSTDGMHQRDVRSPSWARESVRRRYSSVYSVFFSCFRGKTYAFAFSDSYIFLFSSFV